MAFADDTEEGDDDALPTPIVEVTKTGAPPEAALREGIRSADGLRAPVVREVIRPARQSASLWPLAIAALVVAGAVVAALMIIRGGEEAVEPVAMGEIPEFQVIPRDVTMWARAAVDEPWVPVSRGELAEMAPTDGSVVELEFRARGYHPRRWRYDGAAQAEAIVYLEAEGIAAAREELHGALMPHGAASYSIIAPEAGAMATLRNVNTGAILASDVPLPVRRAVGSGRPTP